jgi:hypothetical protein
VYAGKPPNKKPRKLLISEEMELDRLFKLSLDNLFSKLDRRLMSKSSSDVINGHFRSLFRFFAEQPEPMARDFGFPSHRVSLYLTEVQAFLRIRKLPVYHFDNVEESKRADYELAMAIVDTLTDQAFKSVYRIGSPTMAAVIIVKMGLEQFMKVT